MSEIWLYMKAIGRCISAQIKWLRTGSKYAKSNVVHKRLTECVQCPFNVDERCQQCKCPILSKVELESEFCPIERWD